MHEVFTGMNQRSSVSPSYKKLSERLNPIPTEHLTVNRTHRNLSVVCFILYALLVEGLLPVGRLM
jgi:hypothetical protein